MPRNIGSPFLFDNPDQNVWLWFLRGTTWIFYFILLIYLHEFFKSLEYPICRSQFVTSRFLLSKENSQWTIWNPLKDNHYPWIQNTSKKKCIYKSDSVSLWHFYILKYLLATCSFSNCLLMFFTQLSVFLITDF